MMKMKQVALTAAVVVGISAQVQAGNYNTTEFGFQQDNQNLRLAADAFIVRPLMLGYSALGALGWVLALPVSIPAGNADEIGREWVSGPLKYTFMRPLGQMEEGTEPSYVQKPINWE